MYSGNPFSEMKAEEEAGTTRSLVLDDILEKIRDSTSLPLGLSVSDVDQALEWVEGCHCATDSRSQELKLQLLTHRNSLLPISKLPAEIFSQIFHRCVWQCLPNARMRDWSSSPWGSFTHVCRAWRKIAVEDPSLWVQPCFDRVHLCRLMLDRARDMPLEIIWDESTVYSKSRDVLQLALCKPENIKLLDLEMPYRPLLESLSTLSSTPAVHLKELRVSSSSLDYGLPENNSGEAVILDIIAPQLVTLCLRLFPFPLSLQEPLKHLSHLTVHNSGSANMRIRIEQLLTLLRDSPNLRSIDLEYALRLAPETQLPNESSSFCLSRLESLTVADSMGNGVLEFLRQLSIPRANTLLVKLYSGRELSAEECLLLFSKVQEVARCLKVPPWRNLTVRSNHNMQIDIGSSNGLPIEDRISCASWNEPEPGHLESQFDLRLLLHSDNNPRNLIMQLNDRFPLDRVGALCSDTECGWELTKFLPNLTYICLLKDFCLRFIDDMYADWSANTRRLITTPRPLTFVDVNQAQVLESFMQKTAIKFEDQEDQCLQLHFWAPELRFQYAHMYSEEVERSIAILKARGILVEFYPIESYWPYSPLTEAHGQQEDGDDSDYEDDSGSNSGMSLIDL